MRKLILKISVSVDGFVGTTDGDVTWLFGSMSEESTAWVLDKISYGDFHIMGSRTFHDMAAYWPTSTGPFAAPMNRIPKIVFSQKGITNPGDPSRTTTAVKKTTERDRAQGTPLAQTPDTASWLNARVESDLVGTLTKLKKEEGKPIIAHGGAGFVQSLIATGLIDEYNFLVHPVALGAGLPLFPTMDKPQNLKLITSKVFASGAIANTYHPA